MDYNVDMDKLSEISKTLNLKSLTPLQGQVLATLEKAERLGVISSELKLPQVYQGAIKVLEDIDNPDRFSQAAHSLREMFNLLTREKASRKFCPDCQTEIIEEKCNKCGMPIKEKHREKIQSLIADLDPQGEFNNFNSVLAGMLLKAHKNFVKWAHHSQKDSDFPFDDIKQFEQMLLGLFAPYFDNKTEIKSLIGEPSQGNYEKIIPKFAIRQNVDYFFTNAAPEWFEVLKSNKMFDNPPGAKRENNLIKPVPWPQSKFLKKVVNSKPDEVADIIYACKDTDNWIVIDDFIEAAIETDPKHSAALKKIASACIEGKWLEGIKSFSMPKSVAKLALKLLEVNQDAAFTLFSYIIGPILKDKRKTSSGYEWKEAKPKFESYEYEDVLKELTPKFAEVNPIKTLKSLSVALEEALKIEKNDKDDDSFIWREIVFRSHKHYFELKNELVSRIIEVIPETFERNAKETIELLKSWDSNYSIFRRVGIYTASQIANNSLAKYYLFQEELYFQYAYSKEIKYLLSSVYKKFPLQDKKKIKGIITKGPKPDNFIKNYKQDNGKPPDEQEIQQFIKEMQKPYLEALTKNIKEATSEFDKNDIITGWVGPTSPINEQELSSKSNEELISYLATWKPSEDHCSPSRDGLSSVLKENVKKNPERFIGLVDKIVKEVKKPEYVYGVLRGICETDEEKIKKLDWRGFLLNLKTAVSEKYLFENNDEWSSSAMKAICDVLEAGLNKNIIPLSEKDITWEIIERLVQHPDPSESEEAEDKKKGSRDLVMTAINSVRSKAYETAILHGLWLARMTEGKTKMTPQLKALLESGLDGRKEKSPAVKAIYCMILSNLLYLNKEWVVSNLDKIIPEGEDFKDLFGSFALYAQYSDELYRLTRPKFQLYLAKYAAAEPKTDLTHRVGDFIMIACLRGLETLEDDSLTSKLFSLDDPDISSNAIEFIGRDISQPNEKEHAEIIKKARQIWDWTSEKISKGQFKKSGKEICLQFGTWFKSNAMDKKWLIKKLEQSLTISGGLLDDSYQIILRLMEFAEEYPLEVIRCLILLAKAPITPRFISIFYDKEEFYALLDLLQDADHQEEFGYLIDTLGKCGLEGVESYSAGNGPSMN